MTSINAFEQDRPEWIFNFDVSESSDWRLVVVKQIPGCCLTDLVSLGTVFRIEGFEWPLRAALREATISLTVAQLQSLALSLKIAPPAKGSGSGQKGNVIRIDWVRALVNSIFSQETEKVRESIINALDKANANQQGKVDLNCLAFVSQLDLENQECFKEIKKQAMKEYDKTVRVNVQEEVRESAEKKFKQELIDNQKEKEAKAKAEIVRQWELTPKDLKNLLPGRGSIAGVFYMRYNPIQEFFRSDYPTGDFPITLVFFRFLFGLLCYASTINDAWASFIYNISNANTNAAESKHSIFHWWGISVSENQQHSARLKFGQGSFSALSDSEATRLKSKAVKGSGAQRSARKRLIL